jgi:hypothetical protein
MYIRSRIVISSAIVIMAASAALAKDVNLPKIDLQRQCRTTQTATDELTGVKNPNAFDLCINSEQSARDNSRTLGDYSGFGQSKLYSSSGLGTKLFRVARVHRHKSVHAMTMAGWQLQSFVLSRWPPFFQS